MQDTEELVVMLDGAIYVADVGETEPTDPSTSPGAGWEDLGHVTTDGITFTLSREITDIDSVWEPDPIRKLVTRVPKTLAGTLQQLSALTMPFAFGGGEVTEPTAGTYLYEPPDASELDERAMLWELHDGDKDYFLGYRRGLMTGAATMTGVRNNATLLPFEFSVLTPAGGAKPFFLLTNDPAFEPLAS